MNVKRTRACVACGGKARFSVRLNCKCVNPLIPPSDRHRDDVFVCRTHVVDVHLRVTEGHVRHIGQRSTETVLMLLP